jgi:L-ascorbate metabolism protein UlaG (beta-lactamase superfamily)
MSSSSLAAVLYAASIATPSMPGTRPDDESTKTKAHHVEGGGFDNPWPSWHLISGWQIGRGLLWRRWSGSANKPDTTPPTVPVQQPDFLPFRENPSGKLRATWLGHACYYVEFPSGLRVLFDPVFQERCSPFSWLGPKRYTKMPCEIKDIPIIDAVVISHNHYDHLSHPTVTEIAKRHPNCHFFVPLGNKKWFAACGIQNCTELDWWDNVDFTLTPTSRTSSVAGKSSQRTSITSASDTKSTPQPSPNIITARISCLPCQHISARSITDRAATLWASWAVTSNPSTSSTNTTPTSVYFAGDTGYRSVPRSPTGHEYDDWAPEYTSGPSALPVCPAFSSIGTLRGPFTLGLIPIGAYMPRWIMSPMHADPRDAVHIFKDTRCENALGMHWGTWVLTEEDVLEPPKKLKEALRIHGIEEEGVFDVIDIGASREY